MKTTAYEIVVGNELPRIGSGYRFVYASEGRKWIHVTDLKGEGKTRLSKRQWDKIKKRDTLSQTDIKRGMRKAKRILGM